MERSSFLPFKPIFSGLILDGVKTKTARTKKYGEPGDLLNTGFCRVRLVAVDRVRVGDVADHHWRAEGVTSPDDFRRIWESIHPGRGFRPDDLVWLHTFEVVRDG